MALRDDQELARNVAKIARKLTNVDTRISVVERVAQGRFTSISGGSTTYYNEDGEVAVVVGQQPDGSYTTQDYHTPSLDRPSSPVVESRPGVLTITWDGLSFGAVSYPATTFTRLEVHLDVTQNFPITDENTVAAFTSRSGEMISLALPSGRYYVKFVAVNSAGIESEPSPEVDGSPLVVSQVDGIRTYFEPEAPIGLTTDDLGSLWYDTDNGNAPYRWDGYNWVSTKDADIQITSAEAALANYTASLKTENIYSGTRPTGLDTTRRVAWFDTSNGYKVEYWDGTSWSETPIGAAAVDFDATEIGGIQTYYGTVQPTNPNTGSLWINGNFNNRPERWDGTSWVVVRDGDIVAAANAALQAINASQSALSAAQQAQAVADGAIRTYYLPDAPVDGDPGATLSATGGQVINGNNYRIHRFATSGVLNVTSGGSLQYLIVAGGGAGSGGTAAGGGGGGVLSSASVTVSAGQYSIVVGAGGGGSGLQAPGSSGTDSSAFGNTAIGGGYGGNTSSNNIPTNGANGGSGGGGANYTGQVAQPGQGTSGQGYAGATAPVNGGGGGGGAGGSGSSRNGGPGVASDITGSTEYYGGGGGGSDQASPGSGGIGGGGAGAYDGTGIAGAQNTGGGGGGGWTYANGRGGPGGSGVVYVRYSIGGNGVYKLGVGDLWFDTNGNQAHRWSGSEWLIIEDNDIAVALAAANNAQTTADGKSVHYVTDTTPIADPNSPLDIGDTWTDTGRDNLELYWDGSAWTPLRKGAQAIQDGAVTTQKIVDNAINATKLSANSVTASAIAAAAITASAVAANAITATALAAQAVTNAKLADDAVTQAKIADGAVGTVELIDNAINAAKLAAGSITATAIGAQAIQASAIKANAITASALAAAAITASALAANAVTATALADAAVTQSKIVDNAINAAKLAANSVTATALAANSVTATSIAAAAITASAVAANAITATALAANAVNATAIADGAITTAKLVDDAITNAKLANGAVNTAEIVDDAINAAKIASQAVGATELAATSITATAIAANAITATAIAAQAIYASAIAANQITASAIAANSIYASAIAAGQVTAQAIAAGAITATAIAAQSISASSLAANSITATALAAQSITATALAAQSITATALAAQSITATAIAAQSIQASAIKANAITATAIAAQAITATAIAADSIYASAIAANQVTARSIAAGSITATAIAAGAITASALTANIITATAIASGAITATALAAQSITATALAAQSITASAIAAGSIQASAIAANAITATAIAADSIYASALAANAVTARSILAGAITATAIAAGSITASALAANSITATALAAQSITATALAAQSITATALAAQSITATALAAQSITATAIRALAVDATHLSAGSITATAISAQAIQASAISAGAITATALAAQSITATALAAGAITATAIRAGSIQASALQIIVGGGNLLSNSSFEYKDNGLQDWAFNGSPSIGTTAVKHGTKSANINSSSVVYRDVGGLTPGNKYVFSAWHTPTAAGSYILVHDTTGANVTQVNSTTSTGITARLSLTYTANLTTAIRIHLYGPAIFDAVQLEEGDVLTSYNPKAAEILPGTITAGMLTANAVTATAIQANSITATALSANAVEATAIKAGSINADKLTIASIGDNVLLNGSFEEADPTNPALPTAWGAGGPYGGNFSRITTQAVTGSAAIQLSAPANGTAGISHVNYVPVTPGDRWYFGFRVRAEAASTGGLYARMQNGSNSGEITTGGTIENASFNSTWTLVETVFTVPDGVTLVRPYIFAYSPGAANQPAITAYFDEVVMKKMVVGAIIDNGSITTDKISAGAITAEKIDANAIKAIDLTVSGSIKVGNDYWNSTGLQFPGRMSLPSDATKPASITAALTASSLSVEKDLNILGATNYLRGTMSLANGVTTPTVAPTITATWNRLSSKHNIAYTAGLSQYYANSNNLLFAYYDLQNRTTLGIVNKTTGLTSNPPNAPIIPNFYPYGITGDGTNYYLLGKTSDGLGYVYKYNSSFALIGSKTLPGYYVSPGYGGNPTIGWHNAGYIMVARAGVSDSNSIQTQFLNYDLSSYSEFLLTDFAGIGAANLYYFGSQQYDYTDGKYIVGVQNNANFVLNTSNNREGDLYKFSAPFAATVSGMTWDGTRFWTMLTDGSTVSHGNALKRNSMLTTASYTFYDANATNGTHETQPSPAATTTAFPPRAYMMVEGSLAPDSGNTDSNIVDKANQIRIYAASTPSSATPGARTLQASPGVDGNGATVRSAPAFDVLTTTGQADTAGNGFAGTSASAGRFQTVGGGYVLNGDGTGDWPALRTKVGGAFSPEFTASSGALSAGAEINLTVNHNLGVVPSVIAGHLEDGYFATLIAWRVSLRSTSQIGFNFRNNGTVNGASAVLRFRFIY